MNHSFNTDFAELYGIEEAIILENIAFWIKKNESNNKNFYDGYTWTYNSAESFNKLFPYITPSKIRRCLLKLEELEVLKSGNYNKQGYDKTKWYSITNLEVSTFYKLKNGHYKMENGLYKLENRTEQIVEPIPDINTVINSNINTDTKTNTVEIENFFEECWKLYPNKLGKGSIKDKKKKEIFNLGEQFKRCIQRYIENKEEWKAYQNGSTFFNSGYVDYLDSNFKEQSKDYVKQQLDKESEEKYGF